LRTKSSDLFGESLGRRVRETLIVRVVGNGQYE
jgi:hypothetical protein